MYINYIILYILKNELNIWCLQNKPLFKTARQPGSQSCQVARLYGTYRNQVRGTWVPIQVVFKQFELIGLTREEPSYLVINLFITPFQPQNAVFTCSYYVCIKLLVFPKKQKSKGMAGNRHDKMDPIKSIYYCPV